MSFNKFQDTLNLRLAEGRINYAIDTLRSKCLGSLKSHPEMQALLGRLDRLSDTYSHLARFMMEGGADPQRKSLIENIKDRIREVGRDFLFMRFDSLNDAFFTEYRLQKLYAENVKSLAERISKLDFRIEMARQTDVSDAGLVKKREEALDSLFRLVWTLPPWDKDQRSQLEEILADPEMGFDVKAQIISALLLGLFCFDDPAKFALLLRAYSAFSDEKLAARSLTAIVLVLSRWGNSIVSTPEAREALAALNDSLLTYARLRDVVYILVRTRDTDRVSREVKDAFTTTMKEITPEVLEKLQKEGMAFDSAEAGLNPEWEKLMKNKELEEKMKSINDMQLEGMDVMMQTFSRLKNFSFFRNISNWFLPFSIYHSAVSPLFSSFDLKGFNVMADATEMCSGDRFSFALSILQMPEDKRGLLASTLNAQLETLDEMMKDRDTLKARPQFASEALAFSRDLYRFAKLFKNKGFTFDPFSVPLDFLNLPLLENIFAEDDLISTVADFYFDHGYYDLALPLFRHLTSFDEPQRHNYEKIGFCFQTQGNLLSALEAYEKADLFSSDADKSSNWLLKKLAFCNKALGYYDKAAEYYETLISRNPDDLNLEFHLGSVLLRAGKMDEAMDHLSKVHYLQPSHRGCARAYVRGLISRVSDGDFSEALNASARLVESPEAESVDFRLRGHAAFLSGKLNEAKEFYEKALSLCSSDGLAFRRDLFSELRSLTDSFDSLSLQILIDNLSNR